MSSEIIRIKSISELHQCLGLEKPKHPLITIIDFSKLHISEEYIGQKTTIDLYSIALKNADCGMLYGRSSYDFDNGVLIATAPNQIITMTKSFEEVENRSGWLLYFHPDLIRKSPLAQKIERYNFFSYESNEALHLSEQEEKRLNSCIDNIRDEYNERIDHHSQEVILASLELLLSYFDRFNERQMHTRSNHHKDIVVDVENLLKDYFDTEQIHEKGVPTLQFLADEVNLSPYYLSDLLKKETGRSGKDHINDFLVEKAKNKLLSSNETVSEIAYSLGFNYPHYFSRLFKSKTNLSPQEYRNMMN